MPIEIKELHIKASVVDRQSSGEGGEITPQQREHLKKEIIKDCVQEVMQMIEDIKER
jgi:hypothetical protein